MRRIIFLALLFCFALPNSAQDTTQTPYEIALQRIEEAEADGATSLDLSSLGLTELPPEIGNLTNLQHLFLNFNQLMSLPSEIGNLSNLQSLNLENNKLTSLSPEIGNLSNLYALFLEENQLQSLPPEIGNLSSLQSFHLNGNALSDLPREMDKLSNLQALWVSNNQLSDLPDTFVDLQALCILDISHNQFRALPIVLGQLHNLQDNCSGYQNIRTNLVEGNPLISPPAEVIAQGTLAILDYLENEAWWHLQRLIVGGASSLGLVAAFILGMRWRHRGKGKRKNEEKSHV
jgi:internalin A